MPTKLREFYYRELSKTKTKIEGEAQAFAAEKNGIVLNSILVVYWDGFRVGFSDAFGFDVPFSIPNDLRRDARKYGLNREDGPSNRGAM